MCRYPPPAFDSHKNAPDTHLSNGEKIKFIRGRKVHLPARQSHKQMELQNPTFFHKSSSEPNMLGSKRPNSEFWTHKNHRPGQSKKIEVIPSRESGERLTTTTSQNVPFSNNLFGFPLRIVSRPSRGDPHVRIL